MLLLIVIMSLLTLINAQYYPYNGYPANYAPYPQPYPQYPAGYAPYPHYPYPQPYPAPYPVNHPSIQHSRPVSALESEQDNSFDVDQMRSEAAKAAQSTRALANLVDSVGNTNTQSSFLTNMFNDGSLRDLSAVIRDAASFMERGSSALADFQKEIN